MSGRSIDPDGQTAAEGVTTLLEVAYFRTVIARVIKLAGQYRLVIERNPESVSELEQGFIGHLLLAVSDVLSLARFAHPVPFNGLCENDGWLTLVRGCLSIGRIDFVRVVTAPIESPDVLIRHIGHHGGQFRILAEELLTNKGTVFAFKSLVFAVQGFFHALLQKAVGIAQQQFVPVRPPDQLDDIPACAPKGAF